jgi:hypothetical protein
LQDAQDAGGKILGDSFRRKLPRRRRGRRSLGEKRDQRPRALEQRALEQDAFFVREQFVVVREAWSSVTT